MGYVSSNTYVCVVKYRIGCVVLEGGNKVCMLIILYNLILQLIDKLKDTSVSVPVSVVSWTSGSMVTHSDTE